MEGTTSSAASKLLFGLELLLSVVVVVSEVGPIRLAILMLEVCPLWLGEVVCGIAWS